MKFIVRFLGIIALLILMSGTLFSAQTTNFSGQNFSVLVDETRLAAAGITTDAVLMWDYSTGQMELNDAIGAALGGTAQGQMFFWDATAGAVANTEVTEMLWDDTNKGLSIGPAYATLSPLAYLSTGTATLSKATDYSGVLTYMLKTAGASDAADEYVAFTGDMEVNQNGGTVGLIAGADLGARLYDGTTTSINGLQALARMDGGTAGNIYGLDFDVDFNAGTVTDIYGMFGGISTAGAVVDDVTLMEYGSAIGDTIGGDYWGINLGSTIGAAVTGTIRGVSNTIASVGGATAIFGQQNNITKTSDNLTGNFYGTQTNVTNTAGNIGGYWVGADIINTQTAGIVTNSLYGLSINNDQNGGTVSGSSYGIMIDQDFDGTTTGATHGIYINENSNVDYGIYQNGTAMNYYGGSETLVGSTINPIVELPLDTTNGANDALTMPTGTQFTVSNSTGAFSIGGITTGGVVGRRVIVMNMSANNCTIEDDEIASNGCIVTMTGGDLTSTGACSFELIYMTGIGAGGDDGWAVVNFQD